MEEILHYVWKFKLYHVPLSTTDGLSIEVLSTGISNPNAGPDFFNAKLKIGEEYWVGNIEIHNSSSDWAKHKHQDDVAYKSVVLHIVKNADCLVQDKDGRCIPQCQMDYPKHIDENYEFLLHSNIDLPCAHFLMQMDRFHLSS